MSHDVKLYVPGLTIGEVRLRILRGSAVSEA